MDLGGCLQRGLARADGGGQPLVVATLDVHAAVDAMVPEVVGEQLHQREQQQPKWRQLSVKGLACMCNRGQREQADLGWRSTGAPGDSPMCRHRRVAVRWTEHATRRASALDHRWHGLRTCPAGPPCFGLAMLLSRVQLVGRAGRAMPGGRGVLGVAQAVPLCEVPGGLAKPLGGSATPPMDLHGTPSGGRCAACLGSLLGPPGKHADHGARAPATSH